VLVGGVILLFLVSSAAHEAAHATVAWWLGDRRPAIRQRMSLNPIRHIDPILTIVIPVIVTYILGFPFGGAKPVLVDTKIGAWRLSLVSLAGPLANVIVLLLTVTATAFLLHHGVIKDWDRVGSRLYQILLLGALVSGVLALLNMLPIPPFDGARVIAPILPSPLRRIFIQPGAILSLLVVGGIIFLSYRYQAEAARYQSTIKDTIEDAIDYGVSVLRR
jgi:Zn-dependent protease